MGEIPQEDMNETEVITKKINKQNLKKLKPKKPDNLSIVQNQLYNALSSFYTIIKIYLLSH